MERGEEERSEGEEGESEEGVCFMTFIFLNVSFVFLMVDVMSCDGNGSQCAIGIQTDILSSCFVMYSCCFMHIFGCAIRSNGSRSNIE